MDLTKSKKRKISDFFGSMPTKITRYQRGNVIRIGAKAVEEPVSTEPQIPLRKNLSPVNQGTQTDGVYEINSMKKEGLKFLVARISSHESKRAVGDFKICSIADEYFFLKTEGTEDWEIDSDPEDAKNDRFEDERYQEEYYRANAPDGVTPVYADHVELNFLEHKAIEFLETIQEKDKKYRETWEERIYNYRLDSEELSIPAKNSASVDKMTQYGEDNPDEDFFKGVKFMAKEILESESMRLNIQIDDDPLCELNDTDTICPDDCDGKTCYKSYCDYCWSHGGCECNCSTGKCDLNDSDGSDTDESKSDKAWLPDPKVWLPKHKVKTSIKSPSKECDCKECDCAENKIPDLGYLFEKYQVWNSKTPGEMVKELAEKIIEVRYERADRDEEPKYGYGGIGPWG